MTAQRHPFCVARAPRDPRTRVGRASKGSRWRCADLPILDEAQLPSTHYIISGCLDDQQFPRYMNVDHLRDLTARGHESDATPRPTSGFRLKHNGSSKKKSYQLSLRRIRSADRHGRQTGRISGRAERPRRIERRGRRSVRAEMQGGHGSDDDSRGQKVDRGRPTSAGLARSDVSSDRPRGQGPELYARDARGDRSVSRRLSHTGRHCPRWPQTTQGEMSGPSSSA